MISFISVAGLLFALFLPGFLLTLIFFREVSLLERLMLSITFSIMLSVAIGISLGYNQNVKSITGGINPSNVWKWELIITSFLFAIALIANRKRINLKDISNSLSKLRIPVKKSKTEIVKHKKL